MRPVGQRVGEWAFSSRTFSAITDLLALDKHEVAEKRALIFYSMHVPPPLACLLRFIDCNYLLADKASPSDDDWFVEMAHLVVLRYGSESASAPG